MFGCRCILKAFAAALLIAVLVTLPVSAQSTVPVDVKPGDTIEIGQETIILELVDLRNQSTLNPITELRKYKMDDPAMQVTKVVPVSDDTYVQMNFRSLGGTYGRYYPYNAKDGVINNPVIFVEAPATVATQQSPSPAEETPSAGEASATVTATATATATPTTTQAPLSALGAIGALCIASLLVMARILHR